MRFFLDRNISKLFVGFVLAQPVLDLATSMMTRFLDFPVTLGIIVRTLFLALLLFYYIAIHQSKYKKKVYIYLCLLLAYFIVYGIIAVISKPTGMLFTEAKSLTKTFYFPILLVILLDIYYDGQVKISQKKLIIVAVIYFALILLPYITSTGFQSYRYNKPGISGWFYAANETGTILGLLFCGILFYTMRKIEDDSGIIAIIRIIGVALCIFLAFNIGTKVPMLSIFISLAMVFITTIIRVIQKKKRAFVCIVSIMILLVATIVYTPVSPIGKNIGMHLQITNVNSLADFFDDDSFIEENGESDAFDENGMLADPGFEEPDNSTNVIFSSRDIFAAGVNKTYTESSIGNKLFGLGYNNMLKEGEVINIERDFHNVFYRQGIIGFILWMLSLAVAAFFILKKFFVCLIKNTSDYTKMMFICGILLALAIGFTSGHVFTAPAVAIYPIIYMCKLNDELKGKDAIQQR